MSKRRLVAPVQAKADATPVNYGIVLIFSAFFVGLYCFYFIAGGTLDPVKRAALENDITLAQQISKAGAKVRFSHTLQQTHAKIIK